MAVKNILRMGHPLLLETAASVKEFNTPTLNALVDDMFDTMGVESGVGLAAPQIGISQRVIVFGLKENQRYPDIQPIPMTVLVNPEIEPLGDEMESGWEGCLSLPGMRGLVPRYRQIRYRGFDQKGNQIEREVEGFHARVVQHEVDHLDGILYPRRIKDMRMFGFEQELEQHQLETSSLNTPESNS